MLCSQSDIRSSQPACCYLRTKLVVRGTRELKGNQALRLCCLPHVLCCSTGNRIATVRSLQSGPRGVRSAWIRTDGTKPPMVLLSCYAVPSMDLLGRYCIAAGSYARGALAETSGSYYSTRFVSYDPMRITVPAFVPARIVGPLPELTVARMLRRQESQGLALGSIKSSRSYGRCSCVLEFHAAARRCPARARSALLRASSLLNTQAAAAEEESGQENESTQARARGNPLNGRGSWKVREGGREEPSARHGGSFRKSSKPTQMESLAAGPA
eukprot:1920283-Rhodomonas_salina.1